MREYNVFKSKKKIREMIFEYVTEKLAYLVGFN